MEHNRPKVVDCEYYEEGYYAGFFENGGSLLMCDTWVSCQDTRNAIKDLTIVSASFGVQTERDKVPEILARLFNTAHPFANKKRFDTNNSFFNFSRGSFSSYITQMSSAASWKERIKEKQEGSGKHTETDHKWSYDDAQVAFAKGLRSLMNAVNSKTSLYDTFKFEREFNMIWCCGPEKCLKPKPCNEVCAVPTIPPDQPGSGKPDKPLEYPSGKVLKAAFSAKGLDPGKYHIHADRLDKFDCYTHDHEQIRVNELSDSIKLHARIILCFTEKDETEEACGQLGRRIWTYDSSNKTFEKHFYSFPEGEEEF